jgi:hypothetical protein
MALLDFAADRGQIQEGAAASGGRKSVNQGFLPVALGLV